MSEKRRVEWGITFGAGGLERTGVLDVPKNATTDEIEELVQQEAFNGIDWWWKDEQAGGVAGGSPSSSRR